MVDRNPLGQSQDPQRLVSNVTPVAITPAQYGVDTSLATGMAKASQFLLQAANVGTQIANNKQREYEALLKDQGTAIAIAQRDVIAPELGNTITGLDDVSKQKQELENRLNKDANLPASEIKPWDQQESIQKSKDKESLSQVNTQIENLTTRESQLKAAATYIPKGNVAAKAYFETKVTGDLGAATLQLKTAIASNPTLTPEQIDRLGQGIRSQYTKAYLQAGSSESAETFTKGFDSVFNNIIQDKYVDSINLVQSMATTAAMEQGLQVLGNNTNTTTPKIITPISTPGLQKQTVTAAPPVDGSAKLTGKFGDNRGDHNHKGIDLAIKAGSPVKVAVSGTVTKVGYDPGYGNFVFIKNVDGKETRYAHLESSNVQPGQKLGKGVVLGKVGSTGRSTGPHLHFEVRDGRGVAIDPINYINNLNIPPASKTTAMVATGMAAVEKAKYATPSVQQNLRNTYFVDSISQIFKLNGAEKGSKPATDLIDNGFKQLIDSGVTSDRASDILQQFIKAAKEKVAKDGTDLPAQLALRQLQSYKNDNAITKFSTYEIAKANREVQLRDINTAQNNAKDAQWFNEYKTRVANGEDPGTAAAMTSQMFGNPSKNVDKWVTLHNTANNQAIVRQNQQEGIARQEKNRQESQQRADEKAKRTIVVQSLKGLKTTDVTNVVGEITNSTSAILGRVEELAQSEALANGTDRATSIKKAAQQLGIISPKSKAQSPTTNSGGSNKASTVKKSNSQLATGL
jgi:murein DD-endopeptidase MepM/ murein hydrolase activator NlpD